FCGSRPLRTSWLIVGMKPYTLCYRISGGYFAGVLSRECEKTPAVWATPWACASPATFSSLFRGGLPKPTPRRNAAALTCDYPKGQDQWLSRWGHRPVEGFPRIIAAAVPLP